MPNNVGSFIPKHAVILAGGKGTRLGSLTANMPKPLLPVAGKPFIEYVVENLVRHGITELVLSVGFCADMLEEHLGNGEQFGARISYAREKEPLGTGGGARFAASEIDGPFFVLNGDTLLDCDFSALAELVDNKPTLAGMVLRQVADTERYGAIFLDDNKHVTKFIEKNSSGSGLINGGIYLLSPEILEMLPNGPCSIETDLFPALATAERLTGYISDGFFLDMGLPETYEMAQALLPIWRQRTFV